MLLSCRLQELAVSGLFYSPADLTKPGTAAVEPVLLRSWFGRGLPRIAEAGGRLTPDERRNLQWLFRTQSPVNSWTFGPLGRDWLRPKRRPRFLTKRRL